MKFTVFLSTDGKYTLSAEFDARSTDDAKEAVEIANEVYRSTLLDKYGTKQALNKREYSDPDPEPLRVNGDNADASGPSCPKCGTAMKYRNGKFGPFYGCPRYPACDGILKTSRDN